MLAKGTSFEPALVLAPASSIDTTGLAASFKGFRRPQHIMLEPRIFHCSINASLRQVFVPGNEYLTFGSVLFLMVVTRLARSVSSW